MKRNLLAFLCLAALALSTGCRHPGPGVTTIPGMKPIVSTPATSGPGPGNGGRNPGFVQDPGPNSTELEKNNLKNRQGGLDGPHDEEALKAQTVYFDFDRAVIKATETSKIQAVADYLKKNPHNDLLIEGHCDERGTEGYNQALGERRAQAARDKIVSMGITEDRVHTISYGETKPAVQGHTEAAFSKNRRDRFVVLLPAIN